MSVKLVDNSPGELSKLVGERLKAELNESSTAKTTTATTRRAARFLFASSTSTNAFGTPERSTSNLAQRTIVWSCVIL